jgi:hypothetical protein
MYKFEDLIIGDMFNTMSGRWVKIDVDKAICVMSSIHNIGQIVTSNFFSRSMVIVLYSSMLVSNSQ